MATAEEIRYHYDVDNEFYAVFLDRDNRVYSCAVWDDAASLEEAQQAKLARICRFAKVTPGSRLLDIGCGWGGLLKTGIDAFGARHAHGATLSRDQHSYINGLGREDISVSLSHWQDLPETDDPYDAVASVGAFEHFATRADRLNHRQRDVYREFFRKCRAVSKPDSYLALQTIIAVRRPASRQEARDAAYLLDLVFPGSALPTMSDIQAAAADLYEIADVRRIGPDYARTLSCWRSNLQRQRELVEARFGPALFSHYVAYFDSAQRGFESGLTDLAQVSLRPAASVGG